MLSAHPEQYILSTYSCHTGDYVYSCLYFTASNEYCKGNCSVYLFIYSKQDVIKILDKFG